MVNPVALSGGTPFFHGKKKLDLEFPERSFRHRGRLLQLPSRPEGLSEILFG